MAYEIFISYRRKDTGGHAGRVVDHLKAQYGKDMVLFDLEVEGTAERLRPWVQRVVQECAVELVLIGSDWLEDRNGNRRLFEDGDIVRLEIELAIESDIPIIPILVEGASFPDPADLPESINALTEYKGYGLTNRQWDADVTVLVEAIDSIVHSHLPILKRGKVNWEKWRLHDPTIVPSLAFADLHGLDLSCIDLSHSELHHANLNEANLECASLKGANLANANLHKANLRGAILDRANLENSNLSASDLTSASLHGTKLTHANLNDSRLAGARLDGCEVYGVSVWGADLEDALQRDLKINSSNSAQAIKVDSIQHAVVIHMLLLGEGARDMIDAISRRTVLLLGRFTPERKIILDLIRKKLLEFDFVPLMFDFESATNRDFTETVRVLAGMSRFIIADITNPISAPLELQATVPDYMIPFVPIIQRGEKPFSMFANLQSKYGWVLDVLEYEDSEQLMAGFESGVIEPALKKEEDLLKRKMSSINPRRASDYL
jgi:uncharacterized protein YjbI with pentapeptide repeats